MFYYYFKEAKNRILLLLISGISVILVSYVFKEILLSIVLNCYTIESNFEMSYFIFTDVVEVFNVYVFLIFFVVKQVLVFNCVYHVLLFVSPGLTKSEYSNVALIFFTGSTLFLFSVLLFKKLLFPFSWNFFLSFKSFVDLKSLTLHFEAKLMEYVVFFVKLYFTCVVYFQFFLFPIFLLAYFGKNSETSGSFRKFFYYTCFIFSTLVTPPDVTSQIILSVTLIVSCEILIYWSIFKDLLKIEN